MDVEGVRMANLIVVDGEKDTRVKSCFGEAVEGQEEDMDLKAFPVDLQVLR